MNLQPYVAQGQVLGQAVLTPQQMSSMNFAREEFDKLIGILVPLIDPLICREEEGVASDIARHIEQIRIFSGNFCWRHRHLGASYGVVGKDGD
ncbi:hypothetical protein CRX42_05945 [Pseudomonas jessenii]|uniref:Uncharacterized protein n=1 Tax=Pseudomonas jessenii TaxID=77298 RepID=A0A2W0ESW1_PSEJE|nr:hypothetical protein [Pseudomonas jessenii]PYY71493.1 hypothetical protein CRX42_05945 [Pseudomonas jessenii]